MQSEEQVPVPRPYSNFGRIRTKRVRIGNTDVSIRASEKLKPFVMIPPTRVAIATLEVYVSLCFTSFPLKVSNDSCSVQGFHLQSMNISWDCLPAV